MLCFLWGYCIKVMPDSVMDINAWAQEHVQTCILLFGKAWNQGGKQKNDIKRNSKRTERRVWELMMSRGSFHKNQIYTSETSAVSWAWTHLQLINSCSNVTPHLNAHSSCNSFSMNVRSQFGFQSHWIPDCTCAIRHKSHFFPVVQHLIIDLMKR